MTRREPVREERPGASSVAAGPERFPVRTWLIAFAGWMFDFCDLVLFSFLLIPIGRDLGLSALIMRARRSAF